MTVATPVSKTIAVAHPWQNLNTPQTLWAGLYMIWVLDVLLLVAAIAGARVHRDAMQTIGKDTAPSIVHAQHIKTALADMDADVANELLGKPGEMQNEVRAYERRRVEAAKALIEAAKNITFDRAGQDPIEALQVGTGTYEAKVQRARDLHDQGDAGYVNAYRDAARVMDDALLPEADQLDKVNHDMLERAYSEQKGRSIAAIIFILLAGAALVGALLALQKFLDRKTHRILNPMLVLTTLVTLGFVLYTFQVLASERHDLKVAKEDAYDSIHALWRARAVAYGANTDESRYLLDVAHAQEHEQHFRAKAAALASIPSGATTQTLLADYVNGRKVTGFTGYLADELNNITFADEGDAATNALARFVDYLDIDRQIRALQENHKHAEAIELCTGTNKGQSNWAFDQLDLAIGRTLDINQSAFDTAVARGFSSLSHFEIVAGIVAVIIALLAFFGVIQRIQEYR